MCISFGFNTQVVLGHFSVLTVISDVSNFISGASTVRVNR